MNQTFSGLCRILAEIATIAMAACLSAQDAHFRITDAVMVKAPPRIGINLPDRSFHPWTLPGHNLWVQGAGLNGAIVRVKLTLGGSDYERKGGLAFETDANSVSQSHGLGYYDAFRTGFWDGADYVAYRYPQGGDRAEVVRQGKVKAFINPGADKTGKDLVQKMVFDQPGPVLQAGDEIVLSTLLDNFREGSLRVGGQAASFGWSKGQKEPIVPAEGGNFAFDRTEHAPIPGSDRSLRIAAASGFRMEQNYLGNLRDYWIRLPAGKTFTFSMWMKKAGESAATVDVDVAKIAKHSFNVTNQWQELRFDFPAAHPEGKLEQLVISSTDKGPFWLDGLVIYERDAPAGGYAPKALAELKAYRPGVLRIWTLQTNGTHGETLDNAITPANARRLHYARNSGGTNPDSANLPTNLALCEAVGADPWIVVNVAFGQDEWRDLIEYLAGPADSPYGRRRAAAGHPKPYTETFRTIYLELGNEVWSRIFAPWTWQNRPEQAAQYARLMWDAAMSSPHFAPAKFAFIGPGWAANMARNGEKSYGSRFSKVNPLNAFQETAHYTGGFDGVVLDESSAKDEQVFNRLFYVPRISKPLIDTHVKAMAAIRPGLRGASYEGGPGYQLPGPGQVYTEEQEAVGKSLASAITSIDAYMHMQANNFGPLSYFYFGNGDYNWNSHRTDWTPHATFIALGMRNRHCAGDLVKVEVVKAPTVDVPEARSSKPGHGGQKKETVLPGVPDCPTVLCYAFKDGDNGSVMLISREPRATRTVKLSLPFAPAGPATLHRLAHPDPWANNRGEVMLREQATTVPGPGREMVIEIPPHSLSILTMRGR